ncbi:MAG TPA: hypothetical protein VHI50_00210 [Micromonosporaceae bacterium]|nr:hypothetical protein [Micromonosporaceae bacterium]
MAGRVDEELRRAGLRPASFEPDDEGGFGLQVDGDAEDSEPPVSVVWRASRALAQAIIEILRSAGLNAQMSTDDMDPLTVEVFPD